jgi:transposase
MPNNIHFPLTALVNHNGDICNQARLIYAVQQQTGIPIFFRYCPGNVIDAMTLVHCLDELKHYGVNTKHTIIDACYFTDSNLRILFEKNISFVTRMQSNKSEYKRLFNKHINGLANRNNFIRYSKRGLYVKHDVCKLAGKTAYAYICQDRNVMFSMEEKTIQRTENLSNLEVHDALMKNGIFMIIASKKMKNEDILPLYYTRQQVEQTFDIVKNYVNSLPLRVHKEATFRGHLLLTFISSVIMKKLQDELKNTSRNPISFLMDLHNHHCKIFGNQIKTQEVFKKARECYEIVKLECPLYLQKK